MSGFDWLATYLTRLAEAGARVTDADLDGLAPARRLSLEAQDWGRAGYLAFQLGCRHAGLWADPGETDLMVRACLEQGGDYLILETHVPLQQPRLASHTPYFPGVDRLERHAQDLTGVVFEDHPDPRRWTRHQAWPEGSFPLRLDFPVAGRPPGITRADASYPFRPIQGSGVYEIPVGPVHAGIIEPGHFRFQAVGEDVLRLEQRLGYVHKGIEKIAVGRDPAGLARLAGRVSGDSTVAHAWAACQAMERATGCVPPPQAAVLRGLLAERERIANHLGDIGAICNDVGFSFAHVQCARLREQWQRRGQTLFGHRFMMDAVVPGGVAQDLTDAGVDLLRADQVALGRAIQPLFDILEDYPSLEDRLIDTGCLSLADARALGCTGYVGKASGQPFDVRWANPYPPYDRLTLKPSEESAGDVAARMRVRMAEIRESLVLLERLLEELPGGDIAVPLPEPPAGAMGLGLVDGWRGEVLCFVRFGADGRIARFFPRDPSWFTWPALERLILGNIVPDFPVCNKSVNGSYSGQDL